MAVKAAKLLNYANLFVSIFFLGGGGILLVMVGSYRFLILKDLFCIYKYVLKLKFYSMKSVLIIPHINLFSQALSRMLHLFTPSI